MVDKLNELALMFYKRGDYAQAVIFAEQAWNLARHLLGDEHTDVAGILNTLASIYQAQARYSEAELLFKEALKIYKHLLGDKNRYVAITLNNLALLYDDQGRYSEAELLCEQSLDMRRQLFGDEHPLIATSLNNLAGIYESQGRYSKAEPLYEQGLDIAQRLLGYDHYDVAQTLHNLAVLYQAQGRYAKAESFFEQALKLWRRLLGNEHPDVATNLNSLGLLYREQGRYSEAKLLLQQALALRKRLLGDKHPLVAASLNNLAVLYHVQERYKKAVLLSQKALVIRRSYWGDRHPDIAQSLNNLASHYHAQGLYKEAEILLEQGLELRRNLLGNEHPNVATSINNLAGLYQNQGYYKKAETFYLQALELRRSLLGDEHPLVAQILSNLAILLVATTRPAESLAHIMQAVQIENRTISQVFATSSEKDRLSYLQTIRGTFCVLLSLVLGHFAHSPEVVQGTLNVLLKRKALTATALAVQNQALYSGCYSNELCKLFQNLQDLNEKIVHLIFSPATPTDLTTNRQLLAQLQNEYNYIQKILASHIPEMQLQQQLQIVDICDAVAQELPEGTALVEFVNFYVFNFKAIPALGQAKWQPSRYLAFVLPAKQPDKVQMIDLGEAEHIDRLIRIFRSEASLEDYNAGDSLGMVKKKTAPVSKLKTFKYNPEPGIKLREAIFDPIRAVLGESKHLLISPDGELNLIPFQILPIDETGKQLLIDEYTISYLSVGRDVLRSKIQPTRPTSKPLVIADPDFNLNTKQEKHIASMSGNAELLNSLPGKGFNRAPGTRFLGEAIAQKLQVTPYLDAEAVESHVTSSQSPSILLIATHGFFLPHLAQETLLQESNLFGSDRFSATKVENPMLRSGLALAGANIWLSGGNLPEKAGKGFLFAQDVAALDLWANELTVLSACNTAIGDVKIGEGVFGLRRAFAVAGTKTLVMSLWPVPDKATALLMERFFDNLERGFGRSNALLESQNYIRNITVKELREFDLGCEILQELLSQNDLSCQEERPLEHPFYWGAWVCQGEVAELKNLKLI